MKLWILPLVAALVLTGCATSSLPLDTGNAFEQARDPRIDVQQDLIDLYDVSMCWFKLEHSLFAPGAAALPEQSQEAWTRFGKELLAPYLAEPGHGRVIVRLTGQADASGTPEKNFYVGQARAEHVKVLLVAAGVPEGRIRCVSSGESAANPAATPTERAEERCVVLDLAVE